MNKSAAAEKLAAIQAAKEREKQERQASGGSGERLFEWMAPKDLPVDQSFLIRLLPPHPTKNPDGMAHIARASIFLGRPTVKSPYDKPGRPEKGQQTFFLHKESYRDGEPYHNYIENLKAKLDSYWEVNGYPSSDQFASPEDCKYFIESLDAAMNPCWTTDEFPILLYASFDVVPDQRGDKTYQKFVNYRPDPKNPVSRLLQVSQSTLMEAYYALECEHQTSLDDDVVYGPERYLASPTEGKMLKLTRRSKAYTLEATGDTGKLAKNLLERYGPDAEAYPDLEEKRKGFMKNEAEMRDLVRSSWWGQYIESAYKIKL